MIAEWLTYLTAPCPAHLAWLRSLSGTVCLVTDVERLYCRGGAIKERDDALAGVVPPNPEREWMRDIAPAPEALPDVDLRFRVRGGVY